MKNVAYGRILDFVFLGGLLMGVVAMGCDGILGLDQLVIGCTEGEKRCSPTYGNWPQICDAEGIWRNEQPCAANQTCESGACVVLVECRPKDVGCADDHTPQECSAAGMWERLPGCTEGKTCLEGSCKCPLPEAQRCIGNAPAICTNNGEWQTSGSCMSQTCVETNDSKAMCQGACAPGTRCLGNTPQTCNAQGQWEGSTPCSNGEECKSGSCTCIVGDLRCFGNTRQLCNASSQWEDFGAPCTGQTCDPDMVACVGVCEPGQKQCANMNSVQQCGPKGEWQTVDTCMLGCLSGSCASCTPGQLRCAGNTPQSCGPIGQWVDETNCVEQTCIAGICQGQCQSGTKRCSANYPQVCNLNGAWENNGQVCGTCVDCNLGTCNANPVPTNMCAEPTSIEVGAFHTCALMPQGTTKCWGYNANGQLGLGDTHNRGDDAGEMGSALPTILLGPGIVVQDIRVGTAHNCARFSNGNVKCWGKNAFGQLGLGDTNQRGALPSEMDTNLPFVDLGGSTALALSAGESHTCASLSDGTLRCWGANFYGQLGLGHTSTRGDEPNEMGANLMAIDLGTGLGSIALRAGGSHTCAVVSPIGIKCWGNNAFGQLGLGDTNHRGDQPNEMGQNLPMVDLQIPPGIIVKDISAGATHTCVLLSDGGIRCWGNNAFGQLGLGDTNDRGDNPGEMGPNLASVDLGLDMGITALGVSAGVDHTCALLSNGSVKCWGNNDSGQLGLGDTNHRGDNPGEMGLALHTIRLGEGVTAKAIHAGRSHTCALLSSGRVKCWGRNLYGQLGLSDTRQRGADVDDMGDKLLVVDL